MDPLTSPWAPQLFAAVDRAYEVFGRGHVSRWLEVCQCPVCMADETRQQIIATRNDLMPVDLIQEYSNSAHGVPSRLDDLTLLLPCYLELMAGDEMVDQVGVGTELHRFGQAAAAHPGLFDAAQRAVLDDWARSMVTHFAWVACQEDGALYTPFDLTETLLCGGWSVTVVTGALEAAFAQAETGAEALRGFAAAAMRGPIRRHGRIGVDWFALQYCPQDVRVAVAGWLNALAGSDRVLDIASDPAGQDDWGALQSFAWAAGQFDSELFPGPK